MKKRDNLWYNRLAALAIVLCGVLSISVESQLEGLFICSCIALAICLSRKNLFV